MPSDPQNLEARARALAAQLRSFDPKAPSLCLKCFAAFVHELHAAAYEHLGVKVPELYDGLMRFVAADHTLVRDERISISIALLLYQSTECPRCSVQMQQPMELSYREIQFDGLYDISCRLLTVYLSLPYWSTQKKPFRSGRWPSSPSALLPLGADNTIGRLIRSASVSCSGPVVLLGALLQRYRQPVFEAIVNPSHENWLLKCVISAFQEAGKRATEALATHNESVKCSGSSTSSSQTGDLAVRQSLMCPYTDSPRFLSVIFHGIDSYSPYDLFRFAFRHEVHLYRAIISVLVNLSDPTAWEPYLLNIAVALYCKLEAEDRHDPPAFIRLAVADSVKHNEDIYIQLASLLPTLLARRECFGPECGKQIHESSSGKPFAKCARCRAVQYCSKDCQRKDWNAKLRGRAGESHKDICDILSELWTILPPDEIDRMTRDDVARACRDGSLPQDRAQRLARWIAECDPALLPDAFTELLNESIGGTPLPETFDDCRNGDEMLSFLERISGRRYTPGSRVLRIPVHDNRNLSLGDDCPIVPLPSDVAESRFQEIVPEEGTEYSGPYLIKVVPPGFRSFA